MFLKELIKGLNNNYQYLKKTKHSKLLTIFILQRKLSFFKNIIKKLLPTLWVKIYDSYLIFNFFQKPISNYKRILMFITKTKMI